MPYMLARYMKEEADIGTHSVPVAKADCGRPVSAPHGGIIFIPPQLMPISYDAACWFIPVMLDCAALTVKVLPPSCGAARGQLTRS